MNSLAIISFALIASLALALPLEQEQIREKRQMGMYGSQFGSPYGSFGAFPSMGYGSMMYPRSVPMMPMAYAPSLYSPMSMGSLGGMGGMGGFGATNPSFMNMGFRARNRH